jgi:hypothetical protein
MVMSWGVIQYNGKQYLEKFHQYTAAVALTALQVLLNQRVVMQGEGDFLLKDIRAYTSQATALNSFRIRLGNSDGTWYTQGGVGGTSDRVIGSLLCGDAQFPGLVIPYIQFSRTGAITFDIEELANNGANTVNFAFTGSIILPYQS